MCELSHSRHLLPLLTICPPSDSTVTSKSNLDTQNTHFFSQEAYFCPHVNTLSVPSSPKSLILNTQGQIHLSVSLFTSYSSHISLSLSLSVTGSQNSHAHALTARWLSLRCLAPIHSTSCPPVTHPFPFPLHVVPCSLFILSPKNGLFLFNITLFLFSSLSHVVLSLSSALRLIPFPLLC